MSNIVENQSPMQIFQEKVKDKLKKDIGDLLPDEAFQDLVSRATEEMFFQDVTVNVGYNTETRPSFFKKKVQEKAESYIEKKLDSWLEDNEDKIQKKFDEFFSDDKVLMLILSKRIEQNIYDKVGTAMTDLNDRLNNLGSY